jgi:hypothetical protein
VWQGSYLKYKKTAGNKASEAQQAPIQSFLHSATQIGSKILIFGGCDYFGKPLSQLIMYDTINFQWSTPSHNAGPKRAPAEFDDTESAGSRYGHTATLIEMHPPKLLVYGGIVAGQLFTASFVLFLLICWLFW